MPAASVYKSVQRILWASLCLVLIVASWTAVTTSVNAQSPETPSAPAVPAVVPTASDTGSATGGMEIAGQREDRGVVSSQVSRSAQDPREGTVYSAVCPERTGIQATLIIPTSATLRVHGWALMQGDQIAVFSEEGVCAGYLTWTNENAALTLWGDDYFTAEPDGLLDGDSMHVRVRRAVDGKEYSEQNSSITIRFSSDADYLTSRPVFRPDGIYVVDTLVVEGMHSADRQEK